MGTSQSGTPSGSGNGSARSILAGGGLLLAAAVLAAGAAVPAGDASHPAGGEVLAGKVSVLGDAKVRRWTGQTFSVEIPIEWAKIRSDEQRREYIWALLRPGTQLSDAALGDWETASAVLAARVIVKQDSVATSAGARAQAIRVSGKNRRLTDGFTDLGAMSFKRPGSTAAGRYAWRLDVGTVGTTESHYFFSTCAGGSRRETWEVTINRGKVTGSQASRQRATINSMLASFETVFTPAPRGRPTCAGSAA